MYVSKTRGNLADLLLRVALVEALENVTESFKNSMPFDQIARFLPFPTKIVAGYNHNHIQSAYAFDIVTERRTISEGDTLCGRRSSVYFTDADSNCPGCLHIGQGLALRDIL